MVPMASVTVHAVENQSNKIIITQRISRETSTLHYPLINTNN
jgi:hypothetical protein